jgi:protoporphyrinogen oxidase
VKSSTRNIGIVGGGILGLTLAYRFAKDGHSVTVYERDSTVGGLVRSIRLGDISFDRFYHVILRSDRHWLGLINELGLGDRVYFRETKAGIVSGGVTYPMSTISEFFRFPFLSLTDRLRLAATLQYCRMRNDWHDLDGISIRDFLMARGGSSLFEKFWKPLLASKFDGEFETIPMTYIWSRVRRMASTRRRFSHREEMGHIRGNIQIVVDTLEQKIKQFGGTVRVATSVERFGIEEDRITGVVVSGKRLEHDIVISTLPEPQFQRMVPDALRRSQSAAVQYLGIVCIVLVMKEQLSPYHTLSLIDGSTLYTGIIEMTNVIDPSLLNGRHLVYVPKYLAPRNIGWLQRSNEELVNECAARLAQVFQNFSKQNIEAYWIGKEAYVEPVYTLNFHKSIPAIEGPVKGLFVANNSQTYPFLLNCESVVALAARVVGRVYDATDKS